jgi:DDE family transposase
MIEPATFNRLRQFRARVYDCFGPRRDALFELLDAATVAGLVPSLAYLSLPPVHRRRWGSLYDALAAGDVDAPALRELVARYPLDDGQLIFALDTSIWPRDDAETSPGRAYYHSSSRQSAGQPITTGWSYAWLAQLSFTHDSWTAPLDVQRVSAGGSAHAVAAAQIWELLQHVPANGPVPLCVFDAGYDPQILARELAELDGKHVAVLMRLRSDRCFYADPPPAVGTKLGRPQRHGQKFACADERTWWPPTNEHHEQHGQYGLVRVRAWADVHPKTHNHPGKGSNRPRAIVRGTLVLVEVERLPRQTRIPKRLWLWWRGPGQPDLAVVWRAYVHRFDLEHTYRFCKQTLNWTTPRVRTPEQADRWTWLVTLAYTQLRLARRTIEEVHLPWEHDQRPTRRVLTAARVRQSFPQLLVTLDTPANAPKPCGRSPGRPKGARSGRAHRFSAFKKAA